MAAVILGQWRRQTAADKDDDIKLMFLAMKAEKETSADFRRYNSVWSFSPNQDEKKIEYSESSLNEFIERFRKQNFKVEKIELWVEGKAETSGVTRFFVSAESSGGCKLTLVLESGNNNSQN